MVSACVLIRSRRGEFEEVIENVKVFEGVKRIFPVLDRYDIVIDLEAPNHTALGRTVLRLNRMSGVTFTETLVEVQR